MCCFCVVDSLDLASLTMVLRKLSSGKLEEGNTTTFFEEYSLIFDLLVDDQATRVEAALLVHQGQGGEAEQEEGEAEREGEGVRAAGGRMVREKAVKFENSVFKKLKNSVE